MGSCLNHQNARPPVADFLQQQDDHGMRSVTVNNQLQGSRVDRLADYEISAMVLAAKSGAVPDLVCSDAPVTEYFAKPDEHVMSDMRMSGFNEMLPAANHGIMPDLVCSDVNVTEFVILDNENVMSNVRFSGFNYLHGECLTVGENSSPQSFASIGNDLFFNDHGHVTQIDESIVEKRVASLRAELEI
ncbi:hypothetical protein DITRI_Ditri05aG0047500 [Diplodiscus trichospermus]